MNGTLLFQLVRRDLSARYVGTAMGFFWNVLNPLLQLGVYAVVFGTFMGMRAELGGQGMPYTAYLTSGLIPWLGVQEGLLRSCNSLLENRSLIRRSAFPLEIIPLTVVLSTAIATAIALVVLGLLMVVAFDIHLTAWVLLVPVALVVQTALTFGLGQVLAAITVFARDVTQLTNVALMVVFWMTPVVYSLGTIPERLQPYFALSPAAALVSIYRSLLLLGKAPHPKDVVILLLATALALAAGRAVLRRTGRTLVSEI